jgi:hypothetical protein
LLSTSYFISLNRLYPSLKTLIPPAIAPKPGIPSPNPANFAASPIVSTSPTPVPILSSVLKTLS